MSKETKPVVVTVSDEALKNIEAVAKQLTAKGMHITRVMPLSGVITGSVAAESAAKLGSVSGVTSVEDDLKVQI